MNLELNASEQLVDQITFLKSFHYLDESRKINVICTLVVILFGLVGNSITICLFSQKRFRTNSNNVLLLCLAINDSLFLIIHLFEDTIRTIKEIYFFNQHTELESYINYLVNSLNIVDNYRSACYLVNYFRCVLRFISAYIIVSFTVQRVSIVISPLSKRYKSNRFAWLAVFCIIFLGLLINLWVPFAFQIHTEDIDDFCEIKKEWKTSYFILTNLYIFAVIVVPMLTVLIGNLLIILKAKKANKNRQNYVNIRRSIPNVKVEYSNMESSSSLNNSTGLRTALNRIDTRRSNLSNSSLALSLKRINSFMPFKRNLSLRRPALTRFDFKIRPVYQNVNQLTNSNRSSNCLITKILILVSFSYAFLNLPYLITWCLFYNEVTFETHYDEDSPVQNRLFLAVKISEILNILNYGVHFYFYCVSGSMFLNQLKYSSIFYSLIFTIDFLSFNLLLEYFCWFRQKTLKPKFYFERVDSLGFRRELTPVEICQV